jgi:hypothetical protein
MNGHVSRFRKKKPGPGYNASFERKTLARECATAENTRVKECAGTILLYRCRVQSVTNVRLYWHQQKLLTPFSLAA